MAKARSKIEAAFMGNSFLTVGHEHNGISPRPELVAMKCLWSRQQKNGCIRHSKLNAEYVDACASRVEAGYSPRGTKVYKRSKCLRNIAFFEFWALEMARIFKALASSKKATSIPPLGLSMHSPVDFHSKLTRRRLRGVRIKTWTGFMRLDQVLVGIRQDLNVPEIP